LKLTLDRVWGDVRSILVMGFDRVWDDVRLPPVGYANDVDGGGLGSIAEGTLRERFW
jgi:hypothetical protein